MDLRYEKNISQAGSRGHEVIWRPKQFNPKGVLMGKRTIVCFLLGIALAACGGEGDFSSTGNMNTPRHGHTATKLESGEILIAGGLTKTSPLDDFEIYDPAQGIFKPYKIQGLWARGWHKAIRLKSGVLVSGGWTNGSEALRDSYLIQPNGGLRSRAMMKYGRYDHTMTKLPTGDILLAGGNDGKRAIRHLEIYAADKKRFMPARRPMLITRQQHSATQLPGGAVLILGGAEGKGARYAELYLSSQGRTRLVRSLTAQRSRHSATRLKDGRVLITGGLGKDKTLGSAEIFDPATEKFTPLKNKLRVKRQQHTATLLPDGRVVLIGGWGGEGRTLASAEVFEPDKGCFWMVGEMKFPRRLHTATSLGGQQVLIAGGASDNEVLKSAEILTITRERKSGC